MSHHHHHRNESAGIKTAEPISKPSFPKLNFPLFEKNDLSFLALVKPLLSPNGQKLVDLILVLNGGFSPDNPPDLLGLLSRLNLPGENNSAKELLMNLFNNTNNQENETNPNMAMLASLLSSLNQKDKPEEP